MSRAQPEFAREQRSINQHGMKGTPQQLILRASSRVMRSVNLRESRDASCMTAGMFFVVRGDRGPYSIAGFVNYYERKPAATPH